MKTTPQSHPNFLSLVILAALLVWGTLKTAPILLGGQIQWLPATLCTLAVFVGFRLAAECVLRLAALFDWIGSHSGTGKSGTSEWGKNKELKPELCKTDAGPFWGLSAVGRKKLFIDFSSNAYVIGPSGVGKGHTAVVPLIFLIPHSKVIIDYKPELLPICKKGLEQLGQKVTSLNPFGLYTDRVGPTACLNPLDAITDNLYIEGGLHNIFSDADELAHQLYPDPPDGRGNDPFWPSGTRKMIAFAAIAECLMSTR